MIFEITNGKWSIDGFQVPAQCTTRRVRHGEKRCSEVVDGMTLYYIEKKGSRQYRKCALPTSVQSVRSLLLCLDEGSVGTAGVAAAAFHLKKTIWVNPDKIHRVIRDLKLAEGHCCNKLFEKTKLWSSYMFGLNNRPFGSGANASLNNVVVRFPGVGASGRSSLLVSKQRQVNK